MNYIKGSATFFYLLFVFLAALAMLVGSGAALAEEGKTGQAGQTGIDNPDSEVNPPGSGELQQYQPEGGEAMATCVPDMPNMLAYWPLNDAGTGNMLTFANLVAPSFKGFCTKPGCPTRTASGKVGAAYTFVKYSGDPYTDLPDQIDVPAYPALDWTVNDSFSFETWVKIPASASCSGNRVFLGRRGVGVFSVWLGCVDGTNRARFSVRDNTGVTQFIANGQTVLNDGTWHHVVGTRDAVAKTVNLYLDGALETTVNNAIFTKGFSGGKTLGIGYFNTGFAPYYYLEGSLDEVAVYKRALTLEDVKLHYNGGAGKPYCNIGPVVRNPGNKQNKEGDSVSLRIQASDSENGTLNYSATGLPQSLSINNLTGLISGRIDCLASAGSPYSVVVTVKNTSTNKTGSAAFSWVVTDNPNCQAIPGIYLPITIH